MHAQPVYVRDVVEALLAALKDKDSVGKTYSLAGPRIFTCVSQQSNPCSEGCSGGLPGPAFLRAA